MPSLADIRKRIRSVKNSQKITGAMKLVAASKLKRAQDAITQARPYALEMGAMLKRVASHTPLRVIEAKRAIREAFRLQADGVCFTMVEVLSICPTNWGLTGPESNKWLEENMMPYYPLGVLKHPDMPDTVVAREGA